MSTTIDKSVIQRLAGLSKLKLSAEEIDRLPGQMTGILGFIEAIDQKEIPEGTLPLANALDRNQPLRADEVTESNQREQLQAGAPQTHSGLYIVPQVIDEG